MSIHLRFGALASERLAHTLERPLRALRRRIERNAMRRSLCYLDDHTLRDIGMTRAEFSEAVRNLGVR
jgi:uncharacterized protein YjiS (DUF1127 family)